MKWNVFTNKVNIITWNVHIWNSFICSLSPIQVLFIDFSYELRLHDDFELLLWLELVKIGVEVPARWISGINNQIVSHYIVKVQLDILLVGQRYIDATGGNTCWAYGAKEICDRHLLRIASVQILANANSRDADTFGAHL